MSRWSLVGRWAKERPAWFWLVVGYAVFLIYAFPGYMSPDSGLQLLEARSGIRTQAHPPIMAFEWSLLDAIVSGPLLMLLLQSTLFLGGLFVLLRRVLSPRLAAIIASAVLLFPPVITTMAVIWKDSQMAGFIVAGTALLLDPRRRVRIGGLALLTLGCAFRYNAFGAVVPIVGLLFEWRSSMGFWKRYAISGLVSIGVVATALGIDRELTVEHQYLTPAFVDIVGVLTYTDQRYTDEQLLTILKDAPLRVTTHIQGNARRIYSERNPYFIDHGPDRMFDAPTTDLERAALTRAWKQIVSSDWEAYLSMRVASFKVLIGLPPNELWSPVFNDFNPPDQSEHIEHMASRTAVQAGLATFYAALATNTSLFRPYLYLIIGVILLALCRTRLGFAILASGLLYELSFLPAAGTPDFRYSHWMITSVVISIVLVFAQRARKETTS